jgi:hypothetical protein
LECGDPDVSGFSKRGRVGALQNRHPNMKTSMRCAGVAIAICSWIAISNHCAFAAVAPKGERAENDCPFHPKPTEQKEQSSQVQCCKILRAVVPAAAKSWTRDDTKFSDVDLTVEQFSIFTAGHNNAPLLLDTGPPGKTSFAELILQRSLLAHAPPSLA